jgi:hypothetical protein
LLDVRYAPESDQILQRSEATRCANTRPRKPPRLTPSGDLVETTPIHTSAVLTRGTSSEITDVGITMMEAYCGVALQNIELTGLSDEKQFQ